ncbi:MAG: hydrogen gas-evolving membrane-bound hydrogenase subunit E [Thermodesulfovibrionales bacterium]
MKKSLALIAVIITGILLIYGVEDFPKWGDPAQPASLHVSPRYIEKTVEETAVPNMVTSILADYRGYDTMFETTVIFTAGIVVMMLLRRPKKW